MRNSRLIPLAVLAFGAAGLIGQTSRDAYRQAYDAWRQAHANLERDAGPGGAELLPQVDRAAAAAASFEATRAAYLKSVAQDAARRRQFLQAPATRPSPDLAPPLLERLVSGELETDTRTIAKFASDTDRGIQQLRQSLERERVALAALNDTIQARRKAVTATSAAADALEQARAKTAQAFGDQTARFSAAVGQVEKEGPAWADYYQKLAQAIQVAKAPPPVSVTSAAPRDESVTPLPLARYVGAWTYPTVNGIFHGPEPEFVDLVVHEENGHADGTLFGRFKLPPGNTTDPLVRFDFQGDFGPTPTQKFSLVTSDQTQGTIELIPGPAFNLLEVNFLTDPKANKIRTGNFILVKK
jgi:hypothetical protein